MGTELTDPFDDGLDYTDDGHAQAWAPQPGETSLGFHLFGLYKNMPPGKRSAAAVARASGHDVGTIRQLAKQFSWPDRAFALDAYLDRRSVEELARGRTQMRQQHSDLAIMAREKLTIAMKNMDPESMSARDMATWLDLCIKVERQSRGEPDKVTRVEGEISVVEQLDANSRRELMAQAMEVLQERLGGGLQTAELEASILDADVVGEDDEKAGA